MGWKETIPEDIQEDLPSVSSKIKLSPKPTNRSAEKELSAENMKTKDIELINAIIDQHKQQYKPSIIRNGAEKLESSPSNNSKKDDHEPLTDWKQLSPLRIVKDVKNTRRNLLVSQSEQVLPKVDKLKKESTFDKTQGDNTLQIGIVGHHANIEKKIGNLR